MFNYKNMTFSEIFEKWLAENNLLLFFKNNINCFQYLENSEKPHLWVNTIDEDTEDFLKQYDFYSYIKLQNWNIFLDNQIKKGYVKC